MVIDAKTFMERATREQKHVLFKMADLAEKENVLANKINSVFKNARPEGIYHDGDGITICETEDDAIIITAVDRKRLNDIRKRIAALLKKARDEMDMQDVGIVQRQCENYKEWM